jgi:hypothetical protein
MNNVHFGSFYWPKRGVKTLRLSMHPSPLGDFHRRLGSWGHHRK